MSKYSSKINSKIFSEIALNSNNNQEMSNLIKDLLLEEVFSEGKGQWKNNYNDKIEAYIKKEGIDNEN